ncbi:hypothetical protein LTR85_001548 [Meristemomyces frigidus]|nr:hypothetical protein LTR85_001548 [Meristemomyces frigidus]
MFAPMKRTESSILWHFCMNGSGHRLAWESGLAKALYKEPIGTDGASYEVGLSKARVTTAPLLTPTSVTGSLVHLASGAITFSLGQKDIPAPLALGHIYETQVECAGKWTVIFYDVTTQTGWLLDGATALLHICRAWLAKHQSRTPLLQEANPKEVLPIDRTDPPPFQYPSRQFNGMEASKQALLNFTNRRIHVSNQVDFKEENTTISSGTDEAPKTTRTEKTTSSSAHWESVVQDKFAILEHIHDFVVAQKRKSRIRPPTGLTKKLEGYEFDDVVGGLSSLESHKVYLDSSSARWPEGVHDISAISIFGAGFGQLISPNASVRTSHAAKASCGTLMTCPKGKDYLAATLETLMKANERVSSGDEAELAHPKSAFWVNVGMRCQCRPGKCAPTVCDWHRKRKPYVNYLARITTASPKSVYDKFNRGAVLLGMQSRAVRKASISYHALIAGPDAAPVRNGDGVLQHPRRHSSEELHNGGGENDGWESITVDNHGVDSVSVDSVRVDSVRMDSVRVDSVRVDRVDSVGVDSVGVDNVGVDNVGVDNRGVDSRSTDSRSTDNDSGVDIDEFWGSSRGLPGGWDPSL